MKIFIRKKKAEIAFFLLVTLFCYTLNQALLFEKTCVDYSIRIICWITYCFLKPFAAADEWNWAHCLRQIRKGEKAMHKVQVLQGANIALARNIKSLKVQPERAEVWKLCATNPKSLASPFDKMTSQTVYNWQQKKWRKFIWTYNCKYLIFTPSQRSANTRRSKTADQPL